MIFVAVFFIFKCYFHDLTRDDSLQSGLMCRKIRKNVVPHIIRVEFCRALKMKSGLKSCIWKLTRLKSMACKMFSILNSDMNFIISTLLSSSGKKVP